MSQSFSSNQLDSGVSTKINRCWVCQSRVQEFISFGSMPLANGFLTESEFQKEHFTDLTVTYCSNCYMVQLGEQPEREKMFNAEYPFYSGTSKKMSEHFGKLAEVSRRIFGWNENPFVVEIGSNDGIFLKNIKEAGINHLGIEPSRNVAEVARENGIETWCDFFDDAVARKIVSEKGQADVCVAANVMCHIPYLHSVMAGVKGLLKPSGVFIFEDPYLGDIFEKVSYDQIYDEHVFYFSLHSLRNLLDQHDLEIFDVERQPTHGGSMRYFVGHKNSHEIKPSVSKLSEEEKEKGVHLFETCLAFAKQCERSKRELVDLLHQIKAAGKRVVGYAATSKSSTVLNYCEIGPDLVEFIADTTPMKQGKLSPGMHIPVKSHRLFSDHYPDYGLLFGWNHSEEIMAKEEDFTKQGGKWITYVPRVEVISDL